MEATVQTIERTVSNDDGLTTTLSDTDSVTEKEFKNPVGRPKGVKDTITRDLKIMIENALHDVGGEGYLRQQAMDNPTSFMALVGKLIPKDLTVKNEISVHVRHELIEKAVALLVGRDPEPVQQHVIEHKSANY